MSFISNLCLPTPSPSQLARLAKELDLELFGESDDDTTAIHNDAPIENASNAVENDETHLVDPNEHVVSVTSSPKRREPLIHSNGLPHNHQNTNISIFDAPPTYSTSDAQPHASGSGTNDLYPLPTPDANIFQGGSRTNVNDGDALDFMHHDYNQNYIMRMLNEQNQDPIKLTRDDNSLLQHTADNAATEIDVPLLPTPNYPLFSSQAFNQPMPQDEPAPQKNSTAVSKGYTCSLPIAPPSLFIPHNAVVGGGSLPTVPDANNSAFPAQTHVAGVHSINGQLMYYDQFTAQTITLAVPTPVSSQSPDGVARLQAPVTADHFYQHRLEYQDIPNGLISQPEFVQGSSKGGSLPVLSGPWPNAHSGAFEMSQGALHPETLSNLPSFTSDGQLQTTSTSFNNVFPTRSKRPREEEVDTSPPILSAPLRKRRYRRLVQSQAPIETQSTTLSPSSRLSLEQRQTVPPYVEVGPGMYVCNYIGPVALNARRICGEIIKSGTRNRDRHIGTHAEDEDRLIKMGTIAPDAVHALLWVQPRIFKCAISGCDFSIAVWRMDNVRSNHEAKEHPELVQTKKPKGKGKARSQEEDEGEV